MSIYVGPTPATVHRAVNTNVYQNQTLSYEFRVVEHVNDDGKVIAYIMQTQVWAHDPPDAIGLKAMPILVQDWTDVPRVQMKDGKILTAPQAPQAPQNKSPPPLSQATAQELRAMVLGHGAVNPTTFVQVGRW